ncbi:MAG: DUF4390 domain-containing protein [Betaproteobacteria bacterium]|nr:DUF4390 domain-containing protein [Betaproteobacteria bacterium]
MPLPSVRRFTMQGLLQGWLRLALGASLLALTLATATAARAQGVELATLQVQRFEGALTLDFTARVSLPRTVEEALQRGVPIYFVAEARLLRDRWYWRDERVARVSRSWRVAYQPLTGSWRVGLGGLNQTFPSLSEALAIASRSAGWKLADLSQLDVDKSYYVEFSYRLDTTQLPGPMQFGLGGQGEWAVGASRVLKVELGTP